MNKQRIAFSETLKLIKRRPSVYKLLDQPNINHFNEDIKDIKGISSMIRMLKQKDSSSSKKLDQKSIRSFDSNHKSREQLKKTSIRQSLFGESKYKDSSSMPSTEWLSSFINPTSHYKRNTNLRNRKALAFSSFDDISKQLTGQEILYNDILTESSIVNRHMMNKTNQIIRFGQMGKTNCVLIDEARDRVFKRKSIKLFKFIKKRIANTGEVFVMKREDQFKKYLIDTYITTLIDYKKPPSSNSKRKIFVIPHGTVIINPDLISGLILEIPTFDELTKPINNNNDKKQKMFNSFLLYCKNEFNAKISFAHLYDCNCKEIYSLNKIKPEDRFVYVSVSPFFKGPSLSLSQNMIELYKSLYSYLDNSIVNGNNSSDSDTNRTNKTIRVITNKDNDNMVYDLYFGHKQNKQFMRKTKINIYKGTNSNNTRSFNEGVDRDIVEYVYYSDNEKRKNEAYLLLQKEMKTKADFFINSQNDLCDTKIRLLKKKFLSQKKEYNQCNTKLNILIDEYMKNSKIKKKSFKENENNKKINVTSNDILDSIRLLKQEKPLLKLDNFILRKNPKKNFPIIHKNIIRISSQYHLNTKKVNDEYHHLFNHNIPQILINNPKYERKDLFYLFTQFKSLLDVWYNINKGVKVKETGLDYNIFRVCSNNNLLNDKGSLVQLIFRHLKKRPDGRLSLNHFVEGMSALSQNDLKDQISFFLECLDTKNKGKFSFEEIELISKMAIQRLLKDESENNKIVSDLSSFFATYIYYLAHTDISNYLSIDKLKSMINLNRKEIEYLEVFCCIFKVN